MLKSVISSPSNKILPEVGFKIPAIILARVDFPLPFGPVIATNFSSNARLISLKISLTAEVLPAFSDHGKYKHSGN